MAVSTVNLPERLDADFCSLGPQTAGVVAASGNYLSFYSAKTTEAPVLADQTWELSVGSDNSFALRGQSAGPSPATIPIVVRPDGSVHIANLIVGDSGGGSSSGGAALSYEGPFDLTKAYVSGSVVVGDLDSRLYVAVQPSQGKAPAVDDGSNWKALAQNASPKTNLLWDSMTDAPLIGLSNTTQGTAFDLGVADAKGVFHPSFTLLRNKRYLLIARGHVLCAGTTPTNPADFVTVAWRNRSDSQPASAHDIATTVGIGGMSPNGRPLVYWSMSSIVSDGEADVTLDQFYAEGRISDETASFGIFITAYSAVELP